jgi:hypothetical protein
LRKWSHKVFTENPVLDTSKVVPLKELEKLHSNEIRNREVDLIVKIVHIFRTKENHIEVRMIDESNEIWFAEVF